MASRTFAVLPPDPRRRTAPALSPYRRPGIDVRNVPSLASAAPREAAALDQRDRIASQEMARQEREQRQAFERQQKANAADATRTHNIQAEAEYRSAGVQNYVDAEHRIQPIVDDQGKPVYTPKTGKPEWDATGKAFQMVRDESGAVRQQFVDRSAPIGPDPNDKAGKFIYRKNTQSPWDAIDPEAGLQDPDATVRQASARHLKEKRLKDLTEEEANIRADHDVAMIDNPTRKELSEAQYDLQSDDPGRRAAAQATIDARKRVEDLVRKKAENARRKADLANQDDDTFSQGYLAEKMAAGGFAAVQQGAEQATATHQAALQQRAATFHVERASLESDLAKMELRAQEGLTAEESAAFYGQRAALMERRKEMDARGAMLQADTARFTDFQKKRQREQMEAGSAIAGAKNAGLNVVQKVRDFFAPSEKQGDANATASKATPIDAESVELGAQEKKEAKAALQSGPGDTKALTESVKKLSAAAHPSLANLNKPELHGKNVYLPVSGDSVKVGGESKTEVIGHDFLLGKRDTYKRTVGEILPPGEGPGQEVSAHLARRDLTAKMGKLRERMETAVSQPDPDPEELKKIESELSGMRRAAFMGLVPVNQVVDAYRRAGVEVEDVPPVEAYLTRPWEHGGPNTGHIDLEAKGLLAQQFRAQRLDEYRKKYQGQPLYNEAAVDGIAGKQAARLKGEQNRLLPRNKQLGIQLGNATDNYLSTWNLFRSAWNVATGDREEAGESLKKVQKYSQQIAERGEVGGSGEDSWLGQKGVNTVVSMVPDMAETILTTVGGAAVGTILGPGGTAAGGASGIFAKSALKKVLRKEAERLVGTGMARGAAESKAAGLIAKGLAAEASTGGKGVYSKMLKNEVAQTFAKTGVFASSFRGNAGEMLNNTLGRMTPEELISDPAKADRAVISSLALGVPAAMLDAIDGVESGMAAKIIGQPARKLRARADAAVTDWMKEAVKAVGKEAATGFGQGLLGVANQRIVDKKDLTAPLTAEEKQSLLDNAMGEAIGGGAFHLAGSAATGLKRLTQVGDYMRAWKASDAVEAQRERTANIAKAAGENTGFPAPAEIAQLDTLIAEADDKRDEALKKGDYTTAQSVAAVQIGLMQQKRDMLEGYMASGAAVEAELEAAPDDVKPMVRGVTEILRGGNPDLMTEEELAVIGLKRTSAGKVTRTPGSPVDQLPDGRWIVTDAGMATLESAVPSAKAFRGPGEREARESAIKVVEAETTTPGTATKATKPVSQPTLKPEGGDSDGLRQEKTRQGDEEVLTIEAGDSSTASNSPETIAAPESGGAPAKPSAKPKPPKKANPEAETTNESSETTTESQGPPVVGDSDRDGTPAVRGGGDTVKGDAKTAPAKLSAPQTVADHLKEARRQTSGKADEKTLQKFFGAAGQFLPVFSKVFTGGIRWTADKQKSGGFMLNPDDNSLTISLPDADYAMQRVKGAQKWALSAFTEEAIHAVVVNLINEGKIDIAGLFNTLQADAPKTWAKFRAAYPKAEGINQAHEFIRMVVQGRLKLTVEGVTVDGELTEQQFTEKVIAAIKAALESVIAAVKNLAASMPKPLAAEINAKAEVIQGRLEELLAVSPTAKAGAHLPDWMRQNAAAAIAALSDAQKTQIQDLAAERKTAKEIAGATGIDIDVVKAARMALNIPSWTDQQSGLVMGGAGSGNPAESPEFTAWRKQYLSNKTKAEAPEEAPAPESVATTPKPVHEGAPVDLSERPTPKGNVKDEKKPLSPAKQALLDALKNIDQGGTGISSQEPVSYSAPIPKDARANIIKLAGDLFDEGGMDSPEALAEFLNGTGMGKYSQAVWSALLVSMPENENRGPDWAGIYESLSQSGEETVEEGEAPQRAAANSILELLRSGKSFDWRQLFEITDTAWGGTQAEGKYTVKDAYDAMELAVNKRIQEILPANIGNDQARIRFAMNELLKLQESLPTQTKRTEEQDRLQQFSTPPALAFVANWAAAVRQGDVMLEPSAGIGGLAVFARHDGATVIANEFSERRRKFLAEMGFDHLFSENAERLNAMLSPKIKDGTIKRPTVVVMNPPFSNGAESGRSKETMIGAKHVEEALELLADGGRLVAIVGEGMDPESPTFRVWFQQMAKKYNFRANIWMNGQNYVKYGTSFDNRLLIFDKTGPTPPDSTVNASVDNLTDLPTLLAGIRDDRPSPAPAQPLGADNPPAVSGGAKPVQPPDSKPGSGGTTGGTKRPVGSPKSGSNNAPADNGPTGGPSVSGPADGGKRPGGNQQPDTGSTGAPERTGLSVETKAPATEAAQDEGEIFSTYRPSKVHIPGAQKHPADLVESAAMASVEAPDPVYTPNLPAALVKNGDLSDVQLENIVYAGQAHAQTLPDGQRRGYFIGDGTGVGKGRQIAGIILDNQRQGRKRAVWVSKTSALIKDARRDVEAIGMDPKQLREMAASGHDIKMDSPEGIVFVGYDTLKMGHQEASIGNTPEAVKEWQAAVMAKPAPTSRIEQLVRLLGPDFDGVIAFDEAHKAGNAVPIRTNRGIKKPSMNGIAVVDLQRALPNARIVYVSATGATEVSNLGYTDRLGLWGLKTPFPTKLSFFDKVAAGGISAMEIVARDMKALGSYLARSISFRGVEFDRITQNLTPEQTKLYNALGQGWQKVLRNIDAALAATGASNNRNARAAAKSAFFGAQQRFFNSLLTAMEVPILLEKMEERLEAGESPVLQLVNTNEAQQKRAVAKAIEEAGDDGEVDLENLDLSPKDILLNLLEKSFPTRLYHEVADPNNPDRTIWIPVLDAQGKPVDDPKAVAMKEQMLMEMSLLAVPDSAIEQILDHFGAENVAEVTGRSRRLVRVKNDDGNLERKLEKRSKPRVSAEAAEFQAGKRKILIFSDAGGTGFSYHADRKAQNQSRRAHFLVQAGWRADTALQGFGRTHRSNQAQPPFYYLVETNIKGHRRFLSTVARRLSQLGALTAGERKAGSSGMFKETDNLESEYADDALLRLVRDIFNDKVPGWDIERFATQLGFGREDIDQNTGDPVFINDLLDKKTGQLRDDKVPEIPQFLNRILALELHDQNDLFDAFDDRLQARIENAMADGTYDPGTQQYKAKRIEVTSDDEVYQHPGTTARTRIVDVEAVSDTQFTPWDELQSLYSTGAWDYAKNKVSGRVYATRPGRDITHKDGSVTPGLRVLGTRGTAENHPAALYTTSSQNNIERLTESQARTAWNDEIEAAPKETRKKETFIVGALLPIWDRLNQTKPKIFRFTTADGQTMLGVQIPQQQVPGVRSRLGAGKTMTGAQAYTLAYDDSQRLELANGWVVKRVMLSGQKRLEVLNLEYADVEQFKNHIGGFVERIAYETRFFLPVGEKGPDAMQKMLDRSPVVKVGNDTIGTQDPAAWEAEGDALNDDLDALAEKAEAGEYVGDPRLAHSMRNTQIRAVDQFNAETKSPETREQWRREGEFLRESMGADRLRQHLIDKARRGEVLTDAETMAAKQILEDLQTRLTSREDVLAAREFYFAFRKSGTSAGRSMAARVDEVMTPAERFKMMFFGSVFDPSDAAQRTAAKLREQAKNADNPKKAEKLEAEADAVEDRSSKEMVAKLTADLAKSGFTLQEWLNTDTIITRDAPAFEQMMRGMEKWKQHAMRAMQGGNTPFKRIGKQLGRAEGVIRGVRSEFEKKFTAWALSMLQPGMAADDLLKASRGTPPIATQQIGTQSAPMDDAAKMAIIQEAMMKMGLVPPDKQGKAKVARKRTGEGTAVDPEKVAAATMARWKQDRKGNPTAVGAAAKAYAAEKDVSDDAVQSFSKKLQALGVSEETATEMAELARKRLIAARMGEEVEAIRYVDFDDPEDIMVNTKALSAQRGDAIDKLKELWYFNLLSGPKTQIKNFASYPLHVVTNLGISRTISAAANSMTAGLGNETSAKLGDLLPMWKAVVPGIADGWRLAVKAWKTGMDFLAFDKLYDARETTPKEAIGMMKEVGIEHPHSAIKGPLGAPMRRLRGIMQFVDVLGKTIVFNMELAVAARGVARQQQKGMAFASAQERQRDMERRIRQQMNTPNSEARRKALREALEASAQTPLDNKGPVPVETTNSMGELERALSGIVGKIDAAFKSRSGSTKKAFIADLVKTLLVMKFLPFVRTPVNFFRIGLRKSPLGAIPFVFSTFEAGVMKMMGRKGFHESYGKFFEHLGEQMLAWGIGLFLAGAFEGDKDDDDKQFLVTGGGLTGRGDRAENEARRLRYGRDYSFRVGDRETGVQIPYGAYENLGTILGTTVDAARSWKTDGTPWEAANRIAGGLMAQAEQKTFLRGFADFMTVLRDVEGGSGERAKAIAKDTLATMLVPNILKAPIRDADDYAREYATANPLYRFLPLSSEAETKAITGAATEQSAKKQGNALVRTFFDTGMNTATPPPKYLEAVNNYNSRRAGGKFDAGGTWAPPRPDNTLEGVMIDGKRRTVTLNAKAFQFLIHSTAREAQRLLSGRLSAGEVASPTLDTIKRIKAAVEEAGERVRAGMKRQPVKALGAVK